MWRKREGTHRDDRFSLAAVAALGPVPFVNSSARFEIFAMTSDRRHTERIRAKKAAVVLIDTILDEHTKPGFYGKVPLALEVQDGVVQLVRATGAERTYQIGRKAA